MTSLGHKAIRASAGSGKTFQLAHRYILLMARGVSPERIAAVTFTRKAAGEIFETIIRYLCRAADDEKEARATAERIGMPGLEPDDFKRILKLLLHGLHRLQIGTLDSFTVGVAKAFPMELGIPSDFEMVDAEGGDGIQLRERVFLQILAGVHPAEQQSAFREAFKLATFGEERKALIDALNDFVETYRSFYLQAPLQELWGEPERIWPDGFPWQWDGADPVQMADKIADALEGEIKDKRLFKALTEIVEFARLYSETSEWGNIDSKSMFPRMMEHFAIHQSAPTEIEYYSKSHSLSPVLTDHFSGLLRYLMCVEIGCAIKQTRGLFGILDQFERAYQRAARAGGQFTFEDIQYLLTAGNRPHHGSLMTRKSGEEGRLYIDYRLDSRLDHWLVDEFQDTSDLQWEVIGGLADEILQDTSGERSFLFVGDIKQSIYAWRGGNPKLFDRVRERYGDAIALEPLDITYRCRAPVVNFVNQVFGKLSAEDLPEAVIEQWEGAWDEHRVADGHRDDPGYAAVLEPQAQEGEKKPNAEDRFRLVSSIVRMLDPGRRHLTVGVLVRSNKRGGEIVNYLRRTCPHITILHEGQAAIVDNPVVAVLMALIKCAAHPGDLLARRHVQMSPLGKDLAADRYQNGRLSTELMRQLYHVGYQSFIRDWATRLDERSPLDDFGRRRLSDLLDAAGRFDESHDCDPAAFLQFAEHYSIHEPAARNVVRVMTIHQAKGLDFDAVILPDLQDRGMMDARMDLLVSRDDHDEPQWLLATPRRIISESDAVLAGERRNYETTVAYENLCNLYVAVTRAKYALYVISSFPGKDSKMFTPASLVKKQLTGDSKPTEGKEIKLEDETAIGLHEEGDAEWYAVRKPAESPVPAAPAKVPVPASWPKGYHKADSRRKKLKRRSPSLQAEGERSAELCFRKTARDSRTLGTGVHGLFEGISWIEEADIAQVIESWRESAPMPPDMKGQVLSHFQNALSHEEVKKALARPQGRADLWREKSFEIVLGDRWVTGTFDRVVIVRDEKNKVKYVEILDFKTNEITDEQHVRDTVEHYRPQMELYGRVLEKILGIGRDRIQLRLLFTRAGMAETIGNNK